ncbi:MAG: A24 family peptidase [Gallionellaceae bacterium]|nr:A24 family peptidase [Gallionellaceae bacterium]
MFTFAVLIVWAAWLAVYDWRRRRLPNWLLIVGVMVGGTYGMAHGAMPYGARLSDSAGTAVLALVVFWPAYRMGWMGAGDVKLCAVLGWLAGVKGLMVVLLAGSILVGLFGLAILLPRIAEHLSSTKLDPRLRNRIPYGTGLALAFIGWTVTRIYPGLSPL